MANYDLIGLGYALIKRAAAPSFPTGYSAGQLQQQGYELGSEFLRGAGISPDENSARLRDAIVAAKGPTPDDLKGITGAQMRKYRRYTAAGNMNSEMDRWKTWMALKGGNRNVSNADYEAWKKQQVGNAPAAPAPAAAPAAAPAKPAPAPAAAPAKPAPAPAAAPAKPAPAPAAAPAKPAPAPAAAPAKPAPAAAPAAPAQAAIESPTLQDLRGISREQMQQNRKWTAARNMNSELDRWKTWMALKGHRNVSNDDYYAWKNQQGGGAQ